MTQPTNCPECGGELINKSGVSKKTGQPYSFLGCNHYPECRYVWHDTKDYKPQSTPNTGMNIVYDDMVKGFKEVNERLDKMAEFLVKKLK